MRIRDAEGLDDEAMQALARQFNLSETTFLLPPTDPAATARVRIFTPAYAPSHRELTVSRERLGWLLGLAAADIGERPLWVKAGKEQLIVPVSSVDAVRRADVRPEAFRELVSEDRQGMAYVFAIDAAGCALARFFFPVGSSVAEDPATGSATANLGGWWLAMSRPLPCVLECHQGEQVGRPSTLYLEVDSSRRIRVGGEVVELGRGAIEL